MQVLLRAATLFFYCCRRVAAFGSQDLALRTWVPVTVGHNSPLQSGFLENRTGSFIELKSGSQEFPVSFIGSSCCSSHLGLLFFSCYYYFFFLILLLLLFSHDLDIWVLGPGFQDLRLLLFSCCYTFFFLILLLLLFSCCYTFFFLILLLLLFSQDLDIWVSGPGFQDSNR
jgi:hypothetical protein